jgi:Raf kinase inhibitor-like YbhB/YbcL family protein
VRRSKTRTILSCLTVVVLGVAGTLPAAAPSVPKKKSNLRLQSTSFRDGGMIPDEYTCKGKNLSPELYWKGPPLGTKSFAIVCEDPDAAMQSWVHWVIYNIPLKIDAMKNVYELLEGFPRDEKTTQGILQGTNDFRRIGYDGPCPPEGLHRYYFKLYALDSFVNIPAGASKAQLLKAIQGHVLGWTQIMGLYGK